MTLGTASGFVGPVIGKCGFDTCGIDFSGRTSLGKTTAVALGVSAWTSPLLGSGGLLRSMKTTENAIELSARQSNHTILGLDELGHVDGKMVGRTIYLLSGGVSKTRMSPQLTMRPIFKWATFVLLSSEKSLAQKIIGDGGEWTGGMAVRFPDVDCSDVDATVPKESLAKIAGIYHHFGHIGVPYITALRADGFDREPGTGELRSRILTAAEKIAGDGTDSARRRAALPFALILVCGGLAQHYGLLPATARIREAVSWGWRRYSSSVEAEALDPETQALENLRRWIAEHWDVAIKPTNGFYVDARDADEDDEDATTHRPQVLTYRNSRDAFGWYDDEAIYIPTARLTEAIGAVLSRNTFVEVLEHHKLLQRRGPDRASIRNVPKVCKVDVYALKREAFRDD